MAEGFIGGLIEGFMSEVAPSYFNAIKREEENKASSIYKQRLLQDASSQADSMWGSIFEAETNPLRKAFIKQAWNAQKSQNELLIDTLPESLKQIQKAGLEEVASTANIKDINYVGEQDSINYPPAIRARLMAEHLVRPQTQINMNQGRPAPASGYMYKDSDPNNFNQTYIPGGPADPDTKPLTESESKNKSFHMLALDANEKLNKLFNQPDVSKSKLTAKRIVEDIPLLGSVAGTLANSALNSNEQQLDTAKRAFINSILRRDSGATIIPSEFYNYEKTYFPQPGESKEATEFKEKLRKTAIDSLEVGSGDKVRAYSRNDNPVKKPVSSSTDVPVNSIVRRGTLPDGRRVVEFADGTHGYEP